MNEAELIAAARLGDEGAFTELYQEHIEYVRAVGYSILHTSDLDDLCQDTFLLAFTRIASFEGNSMFRTWIARIAVNQCLVSLREGRRASNSGAQLVQMDVDLAAEQAINRDRQLEGLPTRLDLDRALGTLRPIQRRVLEMSYVEDMSEIEISEVLGVSQASAKSKIHHAKRQLLKIYKSD
jgi:RNA polymerase sigma-70 factor (ECF subfamily)